MTNQCTQTGLSTDNNLSLHSDDITVLASSSDNILHIYHLTPSLMHGHFFVKYKFQH